MVKASLLRNSPRLVY
ncbi:hypothetical protein VULLAG_LOCUS580 [Vulpes lagopus]